MFFNIFLSGLFPVTLFPLVPIDFCSPAIQASLSPYRAHGQTPSPGSQSGSDAEYRGRSRSLSARGGSREASPGMPHVNNLYSVSSPNVADLGKW